MKEGITQIFFGFSKNVLIIMMIVGDLVFFSLAKEKANQDLLKKDRKLRNEMIKEEAKAKKYLWKNDFDPMKGFLEFLHELNKSLFF